MKVYNNILEAIGNTPIVKLNKITGNKVAKIYAKLEYLNPAGSIKDRIAMHIIDKAEKRGDLKSGSTIVENTSGNTGAGLAIVAAVKGYKAIFTIPDKMSNEKINFMKAFGAKVIITPTNVPAESPQSYYETAKRIHNNTENSFYVNQYHNPDNPEAHYNWTGPEIWDQMEGKIDYFVAGIGTGGTLSGVAKFLKEKNPAIKIIAVDPKGSVFYDYFKSGKLTEPDVYKLEGIGEDMLVEAMDFSVVDDMLQVNDRDGFLTCRQLARQEGIFAGGSGGAAVWGALQVAAQLPEDKNVLTIIPDTGFRYLSKFYNDEWMRDNGFTETEMAGSIADVLSKLPVKKIISVTSYTEIKKVIKIMRENNISQLPVIDDDKTIGLVGETSVLEYLSNEGTSINDPITKIIRTHIKIADSQMPLNEVMDFFKEGNEAVLIEENGKLTDIITRIDLIEFLSGI